jgi:hypothetical protein
VDSTALENCPAADCAGVVVKLTSDFPAVFVDAHTLNAIECLLAPEERAYYSQHGYPFVESKNGMQWRYLPLQDSLGHKVCFVIDYPGRVEQWNKACGIASEEEYL